MVSSLIPSEKCVQIKSLADPERPSNGTSWRPCCNQWELVEFLLCPHHRPWRGWWPTARSPRWRRSCRVEYWGDGTTWTHEVHPDGEGGKKTSLRLCAEKITMWENEAYSKAQGHPPRDGRKEKEKERESTDLKEVDHVVGAGLQVDPSDGHVLPSGPVPSQVHRHQVVQASTWDAHVRQELHVRVWTKPNHRDGRAVTTRRCVFSCVPITVRRW